MLWYELGNHVDFYYLRLIQLISGANTDLLGRRWFLVIGNFVSHRILRGRAFMSDLVGMCHRPHCDRLRQKRQFCYCRNGHLWIWWWKLPGRFASSFDGEGY